MKKYILLALTFFLVACSPKSDIVNIIEDGSHKKCINGQEIYIIKNNLGEGLIVPINKKDGISYPIPCTEKK